jgi:serine/threonine protein kinase
MDDPAGGSGGGGYLPPTSQPTSTVAEFSLAQIEQATNNFSPRCKLAEGAFGAVYRGKMRPSGIVVAIKVLKPEAATVVVAEKHQQFVGAGSFHTELEVLTEYRHRNIVELLGSCLSDDETAKQCLVFEFMEGGSLLNRIAAGMSLTAQQRFNVASDTARGLEYLHTKADPPIIHQDVKSDNILLAVIDGELVAKVADFGTARKAPTLLEQGKTHHTTGIVIGTKPYQPPEYKGQGHVSEKTDTYAFGVVLCELLMGKPPSDPDSGEMLAMAMYEEFRHDSIERELPPLLAGGAAAWPLPRALALGSIARRCIDNAVSKRCTISDVLVEIDVLAGREAVVRAGRGEEYDPMTGKLSQSRPSTRGV